MRFGIQVDTNIEKVEIQYPNHQAFRMLTGELGANLVLIEKAYGVELHQRGTVISVDQSGAPAAEAINALRQIYDLIEAGQPIGAQDVRHCLGILAADPNASLIEYFEDTVMIGANNRRITPRSVGQRFYLHALRHRDIVFGVGPAGTGKTYLAVAVAAAALMRGEVRRIILTRPAVEAGEKLGFLPGDLNEKINPYLRPLFDALYDMFSMEKALRLIEKGQVEVVPLAFMRGRTLEDAFVILDEAQNTSIEQMKMFLTRLGHRSKCAITGDETQVDLPRGVNSGLMHALAVLKHIEEIQICRFGVGDVVRHSLVAEIIKAYEASGHGRERA